MTRRLLVASASHAGKTVQRLVHDEAGFPHSRARGLILAGGVRRNGRPVARPDERIEQGDRIELVYDPGTVYPSPRRIRPAEGYRVVHEEDDFLVVDKEPGVLTVPTRASEGQSLLERVSESYRQRGFREFEVFAVHRIDRFTSGLVVIARNGEAFARLRSQFRRGSAERVYLAVAEGRVTPDRGRLVHYLAEHPESLKVHTVAAPAHGRRSSCSYRVIERLFRATLIEVSLETGRKNQIRVQLAAEHHALVGDVVYGRPSQLIDRVALHAHRLRFEHPRRGTPIEFEADAPEDFRRLLRALRRAGGPVSAVDASAEGSPSGHGPPRKITRKRAPARRYR